MRPIKLTMAAFGPYAGREVVDFRDVVTSGLFGIYGPPGSGKSTIFSAMTFALFGEASRSEQEPGSQRSDHATANTLKGMASRIPRGTRAAALRRTVIQPEPSFLRLFHWHFQPLTSPQALNALVIDLLTCPHEVFHLL